MTSRLAVVSITPLLLVLALTGCARKSAQAPPQAAAVPAANPDPIPVSEPAASEPTPTDPAPSPVSATPPSQPGADFQPAFFEYDSYQLSDRAKAALDADARALRSNPSMSIVIEGHCDERGTVEYNQSLGERRANVAREYLVASGVNPSRLHVVSYGKDRPFTEGEGESAWSLNRRAHLVPR
jgi:peptidoglycan-associated lipoprotein